MQENVSQSLANVNTTLVKVTNLEEGKRIKFWKILIFSGLSVIAAHAKSQQNHFNP